MNPSAITPAPPANAAPRGEVGAFEERMAQDPRWALTEGSIFFEGGGAVQTTLRKVAKRLGELGIPYAVVGGMALSFHGFPRFTVDVDLLVTSEGLKEIHERLDGLGYVPPFRHSKNLRDTDTGVKIEFLVSGQFPGDGKPKPVAFPDPDCVTVEVEGIRIVNLPTLIELKIASGMTSTDRIKDLGDVQELIKVLGLPKELAGDLNPFVRGKYVELWQAARPTAKRFVALWQCAYAEQKNLQEWVASLGAAPETLMAMLANGVTLDPARSVVGEYAYLVTTDPEIAWKYGMHDESEFLTDPRAFS